MVHQLQHDLLVQRTHDEQSRQEYVMSLRRHLASRIAPHCVDMYTGAIESAYAEEHGHEPRNRLEMREAMRNTLIPIINAIGSSISSQNT